MPGPKGKSCIPCFRSKTKCDVAHQLPCSRCVKRQIEDQCAPPSTKQISEEVVSAIRAAAQGLPPSMCMPCRNGKRLCDKNIPCARCVRLEQEEKCIPFSLWKQQNQFDFSGSVDERDAGNAGIETDGNRRRGKRKRNKPQGGEHLTLHDNASGEEIQRQKKHRGPSSNHLPFRDLRYAVNYMEFFPPSFYNMNEILLSNNDIISSFSPMRISEKIMERNTAGWMLFFMMAFLFVGSQNAIKHIDHFISSSIFPGQSEEEHNLIVEKLRPMYSCVPGFLQMFRSNWQAIMDARKLKPLPPLEQYLEKNAFHGISDSQEMEHLLYLLNVFSFKIAPEDKITGKVRIPHIIVRVGHRPVDDDAPFNYYLNQEAVKFLGYTGQELTYWTESRDPECVYSVFSEQRIPIPVLFR
jgi:hypothetical protein